MPPWTKNAGRAFASRKRRPTSVGGKSSQPPPPFDNSQVLNVENEKWYLDRIGNTILVEIDMDAAFDNEYHFHDLFTKFGWGRMLDFPIYYYPSLVHQFYANIEHKNRFSSVIVDSFVKGKRITLIRQFLFEFFWVLKMMDFLLSTMKPLSHMIPIGYLRLPFKSFIIGGSLERRWLRVVGLSRI